MRIFELARELNTKSSDILNLCQLREVVNPPTSAQTKVSRGLAESIRKWVPEEQRKEIEKQEKARQKRHAEVLEECRGESLLIAAYEGDTERIMKLLGDRGDTSVRTTAGETALHLAARLGWLPMVRLLLDHGMHVDTPGSYGQTPLHAACWGGQLKSARLLIRSGADVNARTGLSRPLTQLDLEKGAGFTPLYCAVGERHPTLVRLLVKHGADVNVREPEMGEPAIFLAIFNPEILICLLDHGADPEAIGNVDMTPLEFAEDTAAHMEQYPFDGNHYGWRSSDLSNVEKSIQILEKNNRLPDLQILPIYRIAEIIDRHWRGINGYSAQLLSAMSEAENLDEHYGADRVSEIVARFLANATAWRGKVASAVKKELRRRLDARA